MIEVQIPLYKTDGVVSAFPLLLQPFSEHSSMYCML